MTPRQITFGVLIASTLTGAIEIQTAAYPQTGYVHPPSGIGPSDFSQPPTNAQSRWRGPTIRQFNVRCWSAEPWAPDKPVGGTSETQAVTVFLPIEEIDGPHLDTTFRQTNLDDFAGGGFKSELRAEDIPAGIFVAFKGHPVFRINKVEYPVSNHDPAPFGPIRTGALVSAEFLHLPTMGECYFYAAIWSAEK
jgi:hypothetical protein